jgi:hypothetical protein
VEHVVLAHFAAPTARDFDQTSEHFSGVASLRLHHSSEA